MLGRYWWEVVRRLDRPGWRHLLVVPGSVWVSFMYRAPCLVYWRNGAWIHRYRGAKIPHAGLGRAAPPAVFTRDARDTALHVYTPDRTYGRVVELCHANGLANVTPLQVAAAESDGTATITDLANHVRNTTLAAARDGIEVPARRLETIAKSLDITYIDLLKVNIEGAEVSALRGLGSLLAKTRYVCIACHDFLADEGGAETLRTKAAVRELLLEHGFELTSRDDAAAPWTRDYVYGVNTRLEPHADD